MVYSAALRQVRDPALADDVAQAVFLLLWQKAGTLGRGTILPAWLHRATGYCAANALRLRTIRQRHELRAAQMTRHEIDSQPAGVEQAELSAILDQAVAKLSAVDRAAVILRYFEGKSAEDVAIALQVTPQAATKRVQRAVAKLQKILARLGVTTATPALATFLAKRCIVPSPPQLVSSITNTLAAAAAGSIGASAAGTITKGAFVAMSAKTHSFAAAVFVLLLLVGSTGIYVTKRHQTTLAAPLPAQNIIHVQAHIDGRSRLCIRGKTVQWLHLEYDPPGGHGPNPGPTTINGKRWYPVWVDVPFGNRQCLSDLHECLDAPLPAATVKASVAFVGRGKVSVVQQPAAANQYTLIVEFDDSVAAGAADYSADISFPPPGASAPPPAR